MDQVNFELLYLLTLPFKVNADSVLDPFPTGGETYGLHISTWGHFSLRLSIVESFWSPSAFMTPEKSVKERRAIKVSRPPFLFRLSEKKFYPPARGREGWRDNSSVAFSGHGSDIGVRCEASFGRRDSRSKSVFITAQP